VVDHRKIFYCIFGLKTEMSNVTFAICHFRFSPIGREIFVSNPHPSLFFGTPVFIFRLRKLRAETSNDSIASRSQNNKRKTDPQDFYFFQVDN